MKMTRLAAAFCAALFVLAASSAYATSITYHVQVNTSSLIGNVAGPFALDFQLNGGSPGSNSATVTNFTFGGGAPSGIPPATSFGLAAGNLSSSVTLFDSPASFFNEFSQGFIPGISLGFDVTMSTFVNAPTPDVFAFGILDGGGFNIPTNGLGDALFLITANSTIPTLAAGNVQAFRGIGAFSAVTVTANPVPEPASLLLIGVGLIGVRRLRKARQ